jgi:hypothetical protein
MKIKRQTIRSLSLHQRNLGLTALEVLTIRQVKVRLITAIRVKQSLIVLLPQSTKKYLEPFILDTKKSSVPNSK